MNEETIKVVITSDGLVKIHVEGVHGPICVPLTASLEHALQGEVQRILHPEYYDESSETEKLNIKA